MEANTNTGDVNNGGGNVGEMPAWMSSMPDAYKQNDGFAKFGEASDAYAKFDDLLKAEGNALVIPGEDATDEDRNAFYSKMGVPETPDAYEIGKPADMSEGMEYSEELEAWYKGFAHQNHLSADQAKSMFDGYNQMMGEAYKAELVAEKAAIEKAENTLKDAWPGDAYAENKEIAHRGFKRFSGDSEAEQKEAHDFINNTIVDGVLLGDHPVFQKLFHRLGVQTQDDKFSGERSGVDVALDDEAKARKRFPTTYKE
jgi:hypothetical protein